MKKIFGATLAAIALSAVAIIPKASAATGAKLPGNGKTSIPIVRRITHVGGHVAANFKYKFVAKPGNPAVVTGLPSTTSAGITTFGSDENKTVSASCSLKLQNMTFTKVGNYAFTVYETETSDELNFPLDTENKYDVYFQVTNVLDNNGEPTGELAVRLLDDVYSYKEDAKIPALALSFEAEARYTYVTLSNKVSGAGADADKYFKYKVDLSNIPEGTALTLSGQDENIEYGGETITQAGSFVTGSGDLYVYLKHGQEVTIGNFDNGVVSAHEIPLGTEYNIQLVNDDESYSTKIDNVEVTAVTKNTTAIGADDFATRNQTVAVNNKDATVNTGVFSSALGYLATAFVGLAGFVVFRRLSRNN